MKKHQTTFHLEEKERETIAKIREYSGVTSDIAALRIALREWERTLKGTERGSCIKRSLRHGGLAPPLRLSPLSAKSVVCKIIYGGNLPRSS